MDPIVAWHFTDPGCPWAYSARPAHARLRWRFGDQLEWRTVLIGLRADPPPPDHPFSPARRAQSNRTFSQRFGMPFGGHVKSRPHATAPACRALVAVREQAPERMDAALRALQLLQFTTRELLDDHAAIRTALDTVPGLDAGEITQAIDVPTIIEAYERDRAAARSAQGTPTEAQNRTSTSDGPVRYTAPSIRFEHPDGRTIEAGGFQPFEGYDLALANLDPSLHRRPAPATAAEALAAAGPDGLTTAEVASILRPSDLVDAEHEQTEAALWELVHAGHATREPAGDDAIWRP